MRGCMQTLGLNEEEEEEEEEAMLKTVFEHLKFFGPYVYLARDTMRVPFGGLKHMQATSLQREQERRHSVLQPGGRIPSGSV